MGRKKRITLPDKFYHVICRGNRRDPLFHDKNDVIEILHMLEKIYEKIPYDLVAYCFMTNHFHLQLRSPNEPLSKIMALLNKRYANYYNTKYQLTGHVFEKRYISNLIEDRAGMLEVGRYIFQNPVKANLVSTPQKYLWSSFRFYTTNVAIPPKYVDTNFLLQFFPGTLEEKRRQLIQYVSGGACHPSKNIVSQQRFTDITL